eukprot:scaffold54577_cov39-Phaeocystis_antarctica.AAC.1
MVERTVQGTGGAAQAAREHGAEHRHKHRRGQPRPAWPRGAGALRRGPLRHACGPLPKRARRPVRQGGARPGLLLLRRRLRRHRRHLRARAVVSRQGLPVGQARHLDLGHRHLEAHHLFDLRHRRALLLGLRRPRHRL